MQIQSNYNSYSNTGYEQTHTHHITNCLHEEKTKRNNEGATGIKSDALKGDSYQSGLKPETVSLSQESNSSAVESKKGIGFLKAFWNSLGDEEKEENQESLISSIRHSGLNGIAVVVSAIRQVISDRIISKWENVREKFKVSVKAAVKRFGEGSAAFGALTDPRGQSAGKNEADAQEQEERKKGAGSKEEPIDTAVLSDSHLMDSYSKTGAYCRLNENLTYQKKSAPPRPGDGAAKGE